VYRNRPRFSIFGVGDYTFSPHKVAIAGFYKRLSFRRLGSFQGKPTVLEDTAYFLPCRTKKEAAYLCSLLDSEPAQEFYSAFIFWDAKRPITAEVLRRLDLRRLAAQLGSQSEFDGYCLRNPWATPAG
jgi:hypothetical protein